MHGIVLAAGGGTRLRPLTDELPKTLLTVDGERTILELAFANLAAVEVRDVLVVSGHAAGAIDEVVPVYASRYGLRAHVRYNDRFATANNAHSLWLTRDLWQEGALIINGDTVHPPSVEAQLLDARGMAPLLLAIDDVKRLADEEMKVAVAATGAVIRISKQLDPAAAIGEYIGVSLIEPDAARPLAAALLRTVDADPGRWYEDGYQEFLESGGVIRTVAIGDVPWVEVDDHADLSCARSL